MSEQLAELVAGFAARLAEGAFDGALSASLAWLACATFLRRGSGRLHAWVWRVALLQFVLLRPFEWHAIPVRSALAPLDQAGISDLTLTRNFATHAWHYWIAAAGCAYVGLVGYLLARLIVRQRRLRRRVAGFARAQPILLNEVNAAATLLSLRAPLEVRVTEAALGPFTLGPWRPVLVLPRWLCVPGEALDAVLLHELAHLRRWDHGWLWLERFLGCVFFFWPPMYWASRKLDAARELACDECALRHGGFSAAVYGQHLVAVLLRARERLGAGGALAMGRSACRLEQRIDRLLAQPGLRRRPAVEAAGLALLGASAFLAIRPERVAAASEDAGAAAWQMISDPGEPGSPVPGAMSEDENMCTSVSERSVSTCVLQGCGTQCAP